MHYEYKMTFSAVPTAKGDVFALMPPPAKDDEHPWELVTLNVGPQASAVVVWRREAGKLVPADMSLGAVRSDRS
jgi:hypothetical protein